MKRIFIFIGLKLVEIAGVYLLFFTGSTIFLYFVETSGNRYVDFFLGGFLGIVLPVIIIIIIPVLIWLGVSNLIKENWERAKRLSEK